MHLNAAGKYGIWLCHPFQTVSASALHFQFFPLEDSVIYSSAGQFEASREI